MGFIQIVLFSKAILNSFYFRPKYTLLLFTIASLHHYLFLNVFYLVFNEAVQLPNALLLPLKLVSN